LEESIEFGGGIRFLRLNEVIVVLAPMECLADWTEERRAAAALARAVLDEGGLYAITGTVRLELSRRAERRYPTVVDWAWAIARRCIEAEVSEHDERSFDTMMTLIGATSDAEHTILYRDIEQVFRREGPYRLARDFDDEGNVSDPLVRVFYQELGRLLYIVNGNFKRISVHAAVEKAAQRQFQLRYGWD
jgi:hypothetical protein